MSSQQLKTGKSCMILTFLWYESKHNPTYISSTRCSLGPEQIHVSKAGSPEENPKLASQALKLMHRFTSEQVKATMDKVEKGLTKS